jgi:hypothetical protein
MNSYEESFRKAAHEAAQKQMDEEMQKELLRRMDEHKGYVDPWLTQEFYPKN